MLWTARSSDLSAREPKHRCRQLILCAALYAFFTLVCIGAVVSGHEPAESLIGLACRPSKRVVSVANRKTGKDSFAIEQPGPES